MHINGRDITWEVDRMAIGTILPWAQRNPDVLTEDLTGMASYFPHWLLLGTHQGRVVHCTRCNVAVVPTRGALRCPICSADHTGDGLLWAGHLPALARTEPEFAHRRQALQTSGWNEITANGQDILLIPLSAAYPTEWPHIQPVIRYAGRWLDTVGLPRASASHHLIGNGQACIYGYNEWQAQPMHSVLQQRMVNHAASLLKIMAGMPPHAAFIGKAHGGMNDER